MRLQQLRYLSEIVRQNLNLSKAAERLHTSQPGISRQIQLLEEELGVTIFVRNGKRIVKLTLPGQAIVDIAEKMLRDADNLKQIGLEFSDTTSGELIIATTHTQARYALPPSLSALLSDTRKSNSFCAKAVPPRYQSSFHQVKPISPLRPRLSNCSRNLSCCPVINGTAALLFRLNTLSSSNSR